MMTECSCPRRSSYGGLRPFSLFQSIPEPNRILRAFGIDYVYELTPSRLNFPLLLFVRSVKSWGQSILKIPYVRSGMQHMP